MATNLLSNDVPVDAVRQRNDITLRLLSVSHFCILPSFLSKYLTYHEAQIRSTISMFPFIACSHMLSLCLSKNASFNEIGSSHSILALTPIVYRMHKLEEGTTTKLYQAKIAHHKSTRTNRTNNPSKGVPQLVQFLSHNFYSEKEIIIFTTSVRLPLLFNSSQT